MENKKYYWLKLKEDFFDDDTISFIEEQENGKEYCLFYLKLCLKSLKTNGTLMRLIGENYIPYDAKALSKLTNTNIDTVTNAMNLFQKIGLISIFETGEIYINQINEMIGKETQMALYMRQKRAKEKLPEVEEVNNVNLMLTECKLEIEIDKDKEIEIENTQSNNEKNKTSTTKYEFKTKDGIYTLSLTDYNVFKEGYKNIDVDKELEKMIMWCYTNETKRKTKKGMKRFINSWLSRVIPISSPKEEKQEETEEQKYFKTIINKGVDNEVVI